MPEFLNMLEIRLYIWFKEPISTIYWQAKIAKKAAMQAYKKLRSNLDKCLSPLNNLQKTEISPSFDKIGVQV